MIYIFRHGMPKMPGPGKFCIGTTDLPLSPEGRFQASLLGLFVHDKKISGIYSSPLKRCVETAGHIGLEPVVIPELREISMGKWDGLSFDEIREKFPREYRLRGTDPEKYPPPGAELPSHALSRYEKCLYELCLNEGSDFAVIGHAGVTRLLLCKLLGKSLSGAFSIKLPYGSFTALECSEGNFTVCESGVLPHPPLDRSSCLLLHSLMGTPEHIVRHCSAVCDLSLKIAGALDAGLDLHLLESAAMLHDIARLEPKHAVTAAGWFKSAGYSEISEIVCCHHDLKWNGHKIDEAAVLYLADKLIMEDRRVTLEERFADSLEKCKTQQAMIVHNMRYNTAVSILGALNDAGIQL